MSTQTSLLDLLDTRAKTTTKPRSQWLTDHLIATGHLAESGLTRSARLRTCSCRQTILAGLDDDIAALEAAVDPTPLTPLGEMLARIEHHATFDLRREGKRCVLF